MLIRVLLLLGSGLLTACDNAPKQKGILVSDTEYGSQWPLNVPSARLDCEPTSIAYIEVGDKRFALNGNALRAGYQTPDEIRKEPGKIFMADFTEKAMSLCLKNK